MSNGAYIFIGIVRVFGVVGGCSYLSSVLLRLIRAQRFNRQQNSVQSVCYHCDSREVCRYMTDDHLPERGCAYFKEVA